jgi:hypothetical protein
MRAVLETLQKVEIAAGGVAESALKEMAPAAKDRNDMTRAKASVMSEVHKCAREHAYDCEHCASIANILDEVGSNMMSETEFLLVITLKQPWATWVLWGWKIVETRLHNQFGSLMNKRIGIHAGLGWTITR